MTIVDERPDTDMVLDDGDGEQSRMHKLLWGDKTAKTAKQSRRGPKRKKTDPTLAGLGRIRAMRIVLLGALAVGALGGTKALLTSSPTQDRRTHHGSRRRIRTRCRRWRIRRTVRRCLARRRP